MNRLSGISEQNCQHILCRKDTDPPIELDEIIIDELQEEEAGELLTSRLDQCFLVRDVLSKDNGKAAK